MELTTERLILREFNTDDWTDVLVYQKDPRYMRYNPWTERTPEAVQAFVQRFVAQQHEQPRSKIQLAVTLKPNHQLIGNCGIRLEPAAMGTDESHEANIGYELAPWCWGHGYATEAVQAIVEFGFTELRLHRISSWCVAENVASARVLEKLGLRAEGRLREKVYFKDRWWDTLLFGILEHQWRARHQTDRASLRA